MLLVTGTSRSNTLLSLLVAVIHALCAITSSHVTVLSLPTLINRLASGLTSQSLLEKEKAVAFAT